ncbi:MAG: serine acetyltransferase [Flavobacterium sp.]
MLFYLKYIFANLLFYRHAQKDPVIEADVNHNTLERRKKGTDKPYRKKFIHLMIYYPEFSQIFFWRIHSNNWLWRWLFLKSFSCKIFKSTKIAGGLVCFHPYASVINAKAIGENFVFRNSLTIGNKSNDNNQLPVIGNNVEVGANVVIIGDITVGNNVTIGAGSVVVKDIPDNCVVAGNPARVLYTINHD